MLLKGFDDEQEETPSLVTKRSSQRTRPAIIDIGKNSCFEPKHLLVIQGCSEDSHNSM